MSSAEDIPAETAPGFCHHSFIDAATSLQFPTLGSAGEPKPRYVFREIATELRLSFGNHPDYAGVIGGATGHQRQRLLFGGRQRVTAPLVGLRVSARYRWRRAMRSVSPSNAPVSGTSDRYVSPRSRQQVNRPSFMCPLRLYSPAPPRCADPTVRSQRSSGRGGGACTFNRRQSV